MFVHCYLYKYISFVINAIFIRLSPLWKSRNGILVIASSLFSYHITAVVQECKLCPAAAAGPVLSGAVAICVWATPEAVAEVPG